jgi:hypothetical protein
VWDRSLHDPLDEPKKRGFLPAGAVAVLAPWPATGSTLAFLKLLLGASNAAPAGRHLLGIFDPTDELVAG